MASAYYQSPPQLLALNERYLSGVSSPYHLALLDDDHMIADLNYFGHVMCDVQEWNAGSLLRRLYFHEQARAGFRINRRERLVKQDDRRVARQSARQSDSLTLAPRHFARILSRGVLDAEERQQFTRPLAFGRFTQGAAVFSGSYSVGDVLLRREMREEQIILEHEPDMPLLDRQIDAGSRVEVDTPVERDAPFIGRDDSGDGAQTCRLPRIGMAKENRHAARRSELDVESEWLACLAFIVSAWLPAS